MQQAYFAAIVGRVDAKAGIIFDCSVITEGVARGHNLLVDATTIEQVHSAMRAYGKEGTKVKVNHWSGFEGIVGSLREPRIEGDRLRADFHLLTEHEMFDLIVEMAESQPSTFGFSISFSGVPEEKEKLLYARCAELYSVDLVDQPAANPTGLFSSVDLKHRTNMELTWTSIKEALGMARSIEEPLRNELAASQNKVTELSRQIADLTKERDDLKSKASDFDVELKKRDDKVTELQGIIDKPEGEIQRLAGIRSQEICAQLGIKPIQITPTSPANDALLEKFASLQKSDPQAAIQFYRDNKVAYDAAFRAKNKGK